MFDTTDLDALQASIDLFQIPVFAVDLYGEGFRITGLNRAHCEVSGIALEDCFLRCPADFLSPEDADWVTQQYRACADSGQVLRYEEELDMPKGRMQWRTTLAPIRGPGGQVTRLIGNAVGSRIGGRRAGRPLFFKEVDHLTALIDMPLAQARQLITWRLNNGAGLGHDDRRFLVAFERLCAMAQAATRDLRRFTDEIAGERPEMIAMLEDGSLSERLVALLDLGAEVARIRPMDQNTASGRRAA